MTMCLQQNRVRAVPRNLLLPLAALSATPAHADHFGPAGLGAPAGSLIVIAPDTLEQGQVAAGFRLVYASPDSRSDAELERLAGEHVHAHDSDYVLGGAVGIAYGLADRLTLSLELPYVRREDLRAGEHSHGHGGTAINRVVPLGSVAGIGDLTLLARYRLLDGPARFALIGGLKAPTGGTHERDQEGNRLETEHQPGSGSWDPIIGAAFGTPIGPLAVNVSALHQFSGKGAQDTRLGDRFQGGIAVSHRFGPPEHHHDEPAHDHADGEGDHHRPHGHSSWDVFLELTGEWEGRQRIAGELEEHSGGTAVWLSPGLRFNSAGGLSAGLGIGIPLWQDIRASHPDNDYRLIFSVGRAL